MSDTTGTVLLPAGAGRFSGVTRVLAGFVIGALFALLPMYYFYMGREAGLRTASAPGALPSAGDDRPMLQPAIASADAKPFASRLTYELAQLPRERPAPPPKAAAPAAPAIAPSRVAVSAAAAAPEPQVSERVANARPISTTPPAPREIEKGARKAEYREASRQQATAAPPSGARVVEGRDIDLSKLPDTPTRPILPSAVGNMRAEIEADRRTVTDSASRKDVAGASDKGGGARSLIALAPGSTQSIASESAPAAPASAKPSASAAGDAVEARLEATREWLAGAPATTHTIQLMGTGSAEHLRSQLKLMGKSLDPAKLYVFRTKAQGKPSITVVYGTYPDRQSALQAMEKLPASISVNKPVLRTVNGIRTELKQNNTSG